MNYRVFLFLVVAIDGFLFVTDAEERGLKDKYMLLFHQVGEELEKERDQQEPDMHAVHIGIHDNDNPVIAQSVQPPDDTADALAAAVCHGHAAAARKMLAKFKKTSLSAALRSYKKGYPVRRASTQ